LLISSVSQLRHFSVWTFDIWTCAVSSIAATAASIAGVDTLKGPRMRFTASTMWAGPNIQPIRSAARPWILEKVCVITVFSVVATSSRPCS
jgi:hypothetical protein